MQAITTINGVSAFESLPAELIHRVFWYLDLADVPNTRLTCSYLAAIGIGHGYQDFSICYKREHFQRLVHIARHPQISKTARSLHYHPRQFNKLRAFKSWQSRTTCAAIERSGSGRRLQDLPVDELRASYERYVEAHGDQRRARQENSDYECLATFFKYCNKIHTVTIGLGVDHDENTDRLSPHTAFSETLVDPVCDTTPWKDGFDWFTYGVRPVHAVARAFNCSSSSVQKLTLINVSRQVLFMSCNGCLGLRTLMLGLRELRISYYSPLSSITWIAPRDHPACQNDIDESSFAEQLRGSERLLSIAPNLEVLELHCLDSSSLETDNCLSWITEGCKWPMLRKLSLSGFCMYEFDLVRFLLGLAGSLEELSCSNFSFVNGDWHGTLRKVKSRMTKLTKIKVKM